MKITTIALMFLLITIPIKAQEKWVNAIGNQACHLHVYLEPHNLAELCDQIKQKASEGNCIRAIGNGYSISSIGCTDGCLISLKQLNNILSVNLADKTVRVEAGITLKNLNEQLSKYNLALSNQAAISEINLGGALSTGVHGTGHTGSLSSFVKEFELVTASGCLYKISLDSDAEVFSALSVGLGSLGVIYAVTLQCESLFYLCKSEVVTDIDGIIKNYSQIHNSSDFFQFLWNPKTGKVLINQWNRCDPFSSLRQATAECVPSYKALCWYTIDENDKDLFSEIAIPVSALPEVVKAIKNFIQKHKNSGAEIVDINVRFVEQDKHAYLSPSTDGPVAYFAFCILEEDKHLAIYKEFEELMKNYNGRPHWGKLNFLKYEDIKMLYGNNLQKFIQVKQRLDPQEIFSNDFLDCILKCENNNASNM